MSRNLSISEDPLPNMDDSAPDPVISGVVGFIVAVYLAEALGGPFGVLNLPLLRLAREVAGFDATRISAWLSVIALPWIAKPMFGAIVDLVPALASRRRVTVTLCCLVLAGCYAVLVASLALPVIATALIVVSSAMGFISAICGGLLVERGRADGAVSMLVVHQRFWIYAALIAAPIAGGLLCRFFGVGEAVRIGAALLLVPMAICLALSQRVWVPSSRATPRRWPQRTAALSYVLNPGFGLIVAFLFLHLLSPSIGTALYFHLTNTLRFDQATIGYLNSAGACGALVGTLAYGRWLRKMSMSRVVYLSILLNVAAGASYLVLRNDMTAYPIYFTGGACGAISVIVTVTLTAEFCPPQVESLAFASMAAIENMALHVSDMFGSYLYDHVTGHRFEPLVLISIACTALSILIVPFLRLDGEYQRALLARVGPCLLSLQQTAKVSDA